MACFLCGNPKAAEAESPRDACWIYDCDTCGKYNIDEGLRDRLCRSDCTWYDKYYDGIKLNSKEIKARAACVAAERKLKKQDGYFLHSSKYINSPEDLINILDFIKDFPNDPLDMFNRALLNLGRIMQNDPFKIYYLSDLEWNILFQKDKSTIYVILNHFEANNLIKIDEKSDPNIPVWYYISITPHGWNRIAELKKYYEDNSSKAFLAMWFDESTLKYREEVKSGAEAAGYELLVVDESHHNDFIMNKVLNMIDEAKFIISDFSCVQESNINAQDESKVKGGVRGGVYFEAGYAKGQGKEVIMTCKDSLDAKKRRHFDVDQINTIFWKEKDGEIITSNGEVPLSEYIKERIIQSVGRVTLYK